MIIQQSEDIEFRPLEVGKMGPFPHWPNVTWAIDVDALTLVTWVFDTYLRDHAIASGEFKDLLGRLFICNEWVLERDVSLRGWTFIGRRSFFAQEPIAENGGPGINAATA